MRSDGGGGRSTGLEFGGGVRYADAGPGLTLAASGRVVVSQDRITEWGVGGRVRLDAGRGGLGLFGSVAPSWGDTEGGLPALWERGAPDAAGVSGGQPMRLSAETGYGFAVAEGVSAPRAGLSLTDEPTSCCSATFWRYEERPAGGLLRCGNAARTHRRRARPAAGVHGRIEGESALVDRPAGAGRGPIARSLMLPCGRGVPFRR